MSERVRVRAIVSGRVQGVGYRFATQREAQRLGLHGWVRNLPDGRVELEAEGPRTAVSELVAWAGRGPVWARVAGVEHETLPPGEDEGFEIRA